MAFTKSEGDHLFGMVVALQAAVRALIISHPNPVFAAHAVRTALQEFEASGLHSTWPDQCNEGLQSTSDFLLHGL